MDFYMGAYEHWLGRLDFPLMVSHGRLRQRRTLPQASATWVCDSRGFTELTQHGRWTITPRQYVTDLRRYRDHIGLLRWASPQDWMCEPWITAKTGLSVAEHQRRTVANLLDLRSLAPDVPIIPVLQGWELGDYLRCVDMYAAAGVDLHAEPVVGLGSVCRRQATGQIDTIVSVLAATGLRLHGFGVKTAGLALYGPLLASADSFAWSFGGRMAGRCVHGVVRHEANCPEYARRWRQDVLARLGSVQLSLALDLGVAA